MFFDFLTWLGAQPSGVGAFLGSLIGVGGGLSALVLGALLNAHLNRLRDDRLRRIERRALALALLEEMRMIAASFDANVEASKKPSVRRGFIVPDPKQFIVVWPKVVDKIGLLSADTSYAVLRAHAIIPTYLSKIRVVAGGEQRDDLGAGLVLPNEQAGYYGAMTQGAASILHKAVEALEIETKH